jgi:imidazolonepropionase-like amidohydrolase
MGEPVADYMFRGRVVDGTLAPPLPDGIVVVKGERIAWVGPAEALPPEHANLPVVGAGPGRTIMPGLIDAHIHISFGEARSEEELALYTPVEYRSLRAMWFARKVLRAGVTSAFDAATTFNIAASVRDAIEAGMFEGPRFAVCGRQLTTHQGLEDAFPSWMQFPPGQAGVLVRSRDEIVEQIRLQVKDGVDVIKISGSTDSAVFDTPMGGSAFTPEEYRTIADETHRLERKVTVHARTKESALYCAQAGFDWLMHASYIDDEGIEACLKHGIAIAPSLTLLVNILESADGPVGASFLDVFKQEVDAAAENLSRAYRAGVPLMSGSETGWSLVPFGQWHGREMQIMVDLLGLTPLQAIHAGTKAGARTLPRLKDEIGSLEAGRYADFIILDGDPTADITLLQKPGQFVMVAKGGRAVDITTPIPDRRVWSYERHRTYLSGRFMYDEATGKGRVKR